MFATRMVHRGEILTGYGGTAKHLAGQELDELMTLHEDDGNGCIFMTNKTGYEQYELCAHRSLIHNLIMLESMLINENTRIQNPLGITRMPKLISHILFLNNGKYYLFSIQN